jgi:hypothetical protein
MAENRCNACAVQRAVVLTIATNAHYYSEASHLASSATAVGIPCICVAISDTLRHNSPPASVVPILIAGASQWRPPVEWCAKKLSGWRHAGILKMHAIYALLSSSLHLLVVDVDWRFSANPLPSLRHRATASVVAARDQTRHMLNIGAMWVAADANTVLLARRAANRTHQAWDQAVWTEEAGASAASCCWAGNLGGEFLVHPPVTRQEKLRVRGSSQECAAPMLRGGRGAAFAQARTMPPPPNSTGGMATRSMWRPHWRPASYNDLASYYYRWRCSECDNKCLRRRCDLPGGSATKPKALAGL